MKDNVVIAIGEKSLKFRKSLKMIFFFKSMSTMVLSEERFNIYTSLRIGGKRNINEEFTSDFYFYVNFTLHYMIIFLEVQTIKSFKRQKIVQKLIIYKLMKIEI